MKYKFLLLFTVLNFAMIFAQKSRFQIKDAKTGNSVQKVSVYQDSTYITEVQNGIFEIDDTLLPSNFNIKAEGFEKVTIKLFSKNYLQIIELHQKIGEIEEVLLRSTNIPITIQNIPASVNIIDQRDFKRNDASNILESFKNAPGVYINQGALNTNKITIRGIGARSQYSTNRIQAYFDGIPLTSGEGDLTLDDFDVETLEKIEILKGPTSSVYGAGLGGSINLFSKNFRNEGFNLKTSSQFGSFNTRKNVLQANLSREKSNFSATFTNLQSDGFRDNGNFARTSLLLNGNMDIGKRGKLSILANYTDLKANIPSSINRFNLENNPQSADFAWLQSEGFESYKRGLFGVTYAHKLSAKLQNTTSLFISAKDSFEPRPFNILEENTISKGGRTKFNVETSLFNLPSEISFGAEVFFENYETGTFENLYKNFLGNGSVRGSNLSLNKQDRNYINIFSQINIALSSKWILEAGFNNNFTNYKLLDLKNTSTNLSGNYQFDPIFSPRIATSYKITSDKNIFASISKGFSIPTVAETLTPTGQINTNLKPETGINYEVGFKGNWFKNRLFTEFSVYSIQVQNLIVAERISEDEYIGRNAGKTKHNGVELLINYRQYFSENFSIKPYINTSLNFFNFKKFIDAEKDFSSNKIPGIPSYTTNLGADFSLFKKLDLFLNYRNVGEIVLNDGNTEFSDQYELFDIKLNYTWKLGAPFEINIYGGINNVFDEKYAASILTNAVGFGGNKPRYFYPGNPRNYFGGMQLNYKF